MMSAGFPPSPDRSRSSCRPVKMGSAVSALLASCLLSLSMGCMASGESPEDELERGRLLCDRDQHAQAIPHLTRAIEGMVNPADAYYLRGVAHEQTDQLEAARDDYLACLEDNPEFLPARNNLGVVFARLDEPEKAIMHLTEVINAQPEDLLAIRNRALCQHDLGRFADSLADYQLAIDLNENDPTTWFQRGNVFVEMGEFELAIADFDRSIELDDQFAPAFMNRGVARYGLGKTNEGDVDVAQAQELDPSLPVPEHPAFEMAPAVADGSSAAEHAASDSPGVDLANARQFLIAQGFQLTETPVANPAGAERSTWMLLAATRDGTASRILVGVATTLEENNSGIPPLPAELVREVTEFSGGQGLLILSPSAESSDAPVLWVDRWTPATGDFAPATFFLRTTPEGLSAPVDVPVGEPGI